MKGIMAIILSLCFVSLFAQISGVYTVGGPGADYTDLQAALTEVTDYNVTGDCVFNINPGDYDGSFHIDTYQYFYQAHNVRLTSATGNAEDVIITNSSANADNNWALKIESVDNITLDNLTFQASSQATHHGCVYVKDASQNITITNCTFVGVDDSNNSNGDLLTFKNTYVREGQNFVISHNNFYNGDTHIKIASTSYDNEYVSWDVYNNFHEGGYCGDYYCMMVGLSLRDNYYTGIHNGVQLVNDINSQVYCNRIFSGNIGLSYANGDQEDYNVDIYNNVIHVDGTSWFNDNNTGDSVGLLISGAKVTVVQHNTVLNSSMSDDSRAAQITGYDNFAFNNLFVSTGEGYGLYITNFDPENEHWNLVRSNVIYSRQSNIVRYGGSYNQYCQELNDFANISYSYNISVNPLFEDSLLHCASPWLDNRGAEHTIAVPRDIEGNLRRTDAPDIGAYEYDSDPSLDIMAGWYTCGTGGDFATLADLAHDLTYRGVSDAVYVNLIDTLYTEQFLLERIPGVGYNRPVVFFGGNHKIRFSGQTDADDNYILKTTRLKYVYFEDIVFETENASYSNLVCMQGFNRSLDFDGCTFNAPASTGSSYSRYSLNSDYYSNVSNVGVHDCTFNGNAYGVCMRASFVEVEGSSFTDHYRGIELSYADTSMVSNNNVTNCSYIGINVNQSTAVQVVGNRIDVSSSALVASNLAMDESERRSLIANNVVHSSNGTGINVAGNGVDILNNTVMVEGDNRYALDLYHFPSNCDIVNNIFVSLDDRAVDCYYYTPSDDKVMDYNCLYSEGNELARLQTTYYDMDDLQASNPNAHQHSIPWNPHLTADMHSGSPYLRNAGQLRNEINDDMDGDLRLGGFDIGADQQTSIYTGSPLLGGYTVGNASSDYTTLQEAIDALELHGAGGDVTFILQAGVYPGYVTIRDFPRPSNACKLLIAGNTAVSFEVEPVGNQPGDNYAFYLRGADNIRFYGLNLAPVSDTHRIHFFYTFGKCDNISLESCHFDLGDQYHFGFCGGDTVGDDLLITGCDFSGGEYGVQLDGEYYNNKRYDGVTISNCVFDEVSNPLSLSKVDDLSMHDNTMTRFSKSFALSYVGGETAIYNNRVYSNGYSGSYTNTTPAQIYNTGETEGDNIAMYNNIIYVRGGTAQSITALTLGQCERMGLNHNTIICNNDSYNEYGGAFSMSNCDTLYVMNNIFSSPASGYPVRSSSNNGCVWIGNAYYGGAEDLGYVDGEYYGMSDFIYSQLGDGGGVFANPLPDSLGYASCSYMRGNGVLTGLATDIDGNTWGAEPDPGATVIPDLGGIIYNSAIVGQGGVDDFANAIDQLMHRGVAGDITLFLAPGTYPPQEIGYIPNSINGSITIRSQSDTPAVIASNATGDADNWGLKLTNACNISLVDIDFQPVNIALARGVVFNRYTRNIVVDNCSFSTSNANPTSNNISALYAYYTPFDNITMKNCDISNMGYGVFLKGFTGGNNDNTGVLLQNNTIHNVYQGVHMQNVVDATLEYCTVSNASGTAIRIEDSTGLNISNNSVEGHGSWGFDLDDIIDNGDEQWIYNNYIEMNGTTNGALRLGDAPHCRVLHNTLRIDSDYSNSCGFQQTSGCADLTWMNNIVDGGEIAPMVLYSMEDVAEIGYNLTYCADAPYARIDGADIASISEYQAVAGDVTTLLMDPDLGEGYYTLAGSNAIDSAIPYEGMDYDIEHNPRTTPDRGCWEHHALSLDIPQNLRIAWVDGGMQLTWSVVTGAATYRVYEASDPNLPFEQWTLRADGVTGTTWTDDAPAARSYYRVTATDAAAEQRRRR